MMRSARRPLLLRATSVLTAVVLATTGLLAGPQPVLGVAFHQYSTAKETTGTGFTGVSVRRTNRAVVGQPNDGCSSPYTGSPVYQTEWVIISTNPLTWREIGTGHQCRDTFRYYFWGYGVDGDWFPIGEQSGIANDCCHTLKIRRVFDDGQNRYQWLIDGVIKATMTSSASGVRVEAGLESYAQGATVAGHNYTTLEVQKLGGAFNNWVGQDGQLVTPGGEMCGLWIAAISWRAGQGAGQC